MSEKQRILYIDDNPLDRALVRDALEKEHGGFQVVEAGTMAEFEILLEKGEFEVVLSDFNILGFNGLQVIDAIREHDPAIPVIIVTGTGSEDIAVAALKRGAADYVIKTPDHIRRLPTTIMAAMERRRLREERRRNEEALQKWGNIFAHAGWGVAVLGGEELRLEMMNPAYAAMHGYRVEELLGRPVAEVHTPESRERLAAVIEMCREKSHAAFENFHCRRDGSVFPAWHDVTTIRDEAGRPAYHIVHVQNISVLKATQQELEQLNRELENRVLEKTRRLQAMQDELIRREKLAAIGQLSGGVAHDLRNPLGVIGNVAYFLQAKLGERAGATDDKIAKHLDILGREVARATRIIAELTDFSKDILPEPRPADLNGVIDEALKATEIADSIAVERQGLDLPLIMLDPEQMNRVFVNLFNNAVQAMPQGGVLRIATSLLESGVEVRVRDSGNGIRPEDMTRIFDPLVTTKAKGIGLGLCIVKDIVEKHGGEVTVESELGKGSTFVVRLPAVLPASRD